MNEEFENGVETEKSESENTAQREQVSFKATEETVNEDIPNVEAHKVDEQPKTEQSTDSSSYYYQNSYRSANTNYSQNNGGYQNSQNYSYQPPVAPIQTPKAKKGLKIFVSCIAIVIVFALGFGVSSIIKYTKTDTDSSVHEVESKDDGPELDINSSPVTPTKISSGGELTPAQIAAKLRPSNVGIVVYAKNSNSKASEGSGVIMGEDKTGKYTYIITCAHVISDSGIQVRVQLEDGTTYDAEIAGFDTRTDLGVLKIEANGLPAAEFGDSDSLVIGDAVYAIGNPGGTEFFGTFTSGHISAIDRPVSSEIGYTMKCIQHNAAINPGNSGGMLVNAYGQVIGINSQKITATSYEGMGFAIPITSAKEIIENLINNGYVPNRPKLGVTYYRVSASAQYSMIAQIKGLPAGTLIINEISSDSSLANSEVRQYDMIVAVDGEPLSTADVLLEKIDNGKVGDKLTLSICRVNSDYSISEFDVEITLVEDKGDSQQEETTTVQYVNPFDYFSQFGF